LLKKTFLGVISAVLIFWLTTALYDWVKDGHRAESGQHTDQGTTPQIYYYGGQVVDDASKSLLHGVEIKLTIGDTTTTDSTDSEGKYLFSIPKAGRQLAAVFVANAAGYQAYTKNLRSDPSGVLESVPIVFLQAVSQPSPQNPATPTAPVAKMTAKWTIATRYVPRQLQTATRIAPSAIKR